MSEARLCFLLDQERGIQRQDIAVDAGAAIGFDPAGVMCPVACAEEAIVMTSGRVRLSVADARDLAEGALRGIGYHDDEARIVADHVIDAALCGYEYSGLAKILNIPESEHFKLPRRPMQVLRETDVSLAFDGGNNVGMLALFHAAQATIEKAAAHGIALVSVTDAWMSGRSAYYVEMIAKAGLVAIHTAASSRLVAPPGGIRPMLGTNPIAIAVPSSRGPIVLDMGTSAYMMTEVMLRERLGELLPEGVAIGPDGEPTRDPALARRGALLPFGGYKGFGLALMMQALGLLGRIRLGCRQRLRLSVHRLPARPASGQPMYSSGR